MCRHIYCGNPTHVPRYDMKPRPKDIPKDTPKGGKRPDNDGGRGDTYKPTWKDLNDPDPPIPGPSGLW